MTDVCFTEVIKVLDGKFCNLQLHQERINRTAQHFFHTNIPLRLMIKDIPNQFREGLVKCRIVYSYHLIKVEYEHYHFRQINSLKLVEDNNIEYSYKSTDRHLLISLFKQRGYADDILIVKNGHITDTSFTNVVFENAFGLFTPSTYLLAGTKRQQLLDQCLIKETDIPLSDLNNYSKLYLINAMIDIKDAISVDLSDIVL